MAECIPQSSAGQDEVTLLLPAWQDKGGCTRWQTGVMKCQEVIILIFFLFFFPLFFWHSTKFIAQIDKQPEMMLSNSDSASSFPTPSGEAASLPRMSEKGWGHPRKGMTGKAMPPNN